MRALWPALREGGAAEAKERSETARGKRDPDRINLTADGTVRLCRVLKATLKALLKTRARLLNCTESMEKFMSLTGRTLFTKEKGWCHFLTDQPAYQSEALPTFASYSTQSQLDTIQSQG